MTSAVSSRLRLLRDGGPLSQVESALLQADEGLVQAWQLELGDQVSEEGQPAARVLRVVEGSLRVSVQDAQGVQVPQTRRHLPQHRKHEPQGHATLQKQGWQPQRNEHRL